MICAEGFQPNVCSLEYDGFQAQFGRHKRKIPLNGILLMDLATLYDQLPYGPAPEDAQFARQWIESHGGAFGHFIDGKFTRAGDSPAFDCINPADKQVLAKVSQGTEDDVARAVAAAKRAQKDWQEASSYERAKVLYALARQAQKHARLFAVLETLDNGKPIRETRDLDVPLVARHFYHHAGWAQLMPSKLPGYRPVGVCGQIIPWNFPLLMLAWKIAPAIAMGNTVVLKPAEFTPLTALLFAEICQAAEVPPGVVNVVTGDGDTGRLLVEHPDVDKIAFTGSTEVGRIIRKATAGTRKRLSLELGGKSPFIVFEDADWDSAIEGIVDAIWFNQGQVCCAGSRLLVQESIEGPFYDKLRRRMDALRVGNPLDKAIDIGAIVAPVQLERIESLVRTGIEEGAVMYQPPGSCPKEGWFYPPTLMTNVAPASTVAQIEIFGPVLVAMPFRTPKEAIELANNTVYGLAASVWTENLNLALDVAAQVKAGTVWINSTNLFDAASGFGGYKESGYGREGGFEGLLEYVIPPLPKAKPPKPHPVSPMGLNTPLDRTYKHYIGGKQARPDQGYSLEVKASHGERMGEVARGNRKDVRNAVEASRKAQEAWKKQSAHLRAQVIYYLAENLSSRRDSIEKLIAATEGCGIRAAGEQVEEAIRRLFDAAAWADKNDGAVHNTPFRGITYTLNEPVGVIAAVCPPAPSLLPFVSIAAVAVALGNAVLIVPSESGPIPAAEFVQVLEASDVMPGVWNAVTGLEAELAEVMAAHDDVDALWHFGSPESVGRCLELSAGNLKQTWTVPECDYDWTDPNGALCREIARRSVQVKNVWAPWGE